MAKRTTKQVQALVNAIEANGKLDEAVAMIPTKPAVTEADRNAAIAASKDAVKPVPPVDWKSKGLQGGIDVRIAESKATLIFIEVAITAKDASETETALFIEGFAGAWPIGSAPVRKSEMNAVIRACRSGHADWQRMVDKVKVNQCSRMDMLEWCRAMAPATGKGARPDTQTEAKAATAAGATAQPAIEAKKVERAVKASRKRAGTVVKELQQHIGAANLSEAMAVADAGIKQIVAVGGDDTASALLRYIGNNAHRLETLPNAEKWLIKVAQDIAKIVTLAQNRLSGDAAKATAAVAKIAADTIAQAPVTKKAA